MRFFTVSFPPLSLANVALGELTPTALAVILALLAGVPILTLALLSWPRLQRALLGLLVFSTCLTGNRLFAVQAFFVPNRGTDWGFEVSVADFLLFAFLLVLLLRGASRRVTWWPYNTSLWLLLLSVCVLSLIPSQAPVLGLFAIHKLVRGFVLFWVTVNLVRGPKDTDAVIKALIAALIVQAAVVFWSKYVSGSVVWRSVGTFAHPNTMAMYVDLALAMVLASALTRRSSARRRMLSGIAILGGMLCVTFSRSRAALVLMPVALGAIVLILVAMRPTAKKLLWIGSCTFLVGFLGVLAAPKVVERFVHAPVQSSMQRKAFKRVAIRMAGENILGVGINAYAQRVQDSDYYWLQNPELLDLEDPLAYQERDRGLTTIGTVHHIYLLYAAETGWLGMAVFILFVGRFAWRTVLLLFRLQGDCERGIMLGIAAGLTMLHLQGLLEWGLRQTPVFFLFVIVSAMMVAMGDRRYWPGLPPGLDEERRGRSGRSGEDDPRDDPGRETGEPGARRGDG